MVQDVTVLHICSARSDHRMVGAKNHIQSKKQRSEVIKREKQKKWSASKTQRPDAIQRSLETARMDEVDVNNMNNSLIDATENAARPWKAHSGTKREENISSETKGHMGKRRELKNKKVIYMNILRLLTKDISKYVRPTTYYNILPTKLQLSSKKLKA